jgi:uncharacterized membrane protein
MKHIFSGSENTILLVAATTTALMTGLFYAFSCSVNPGLARLPDQAYLAAMQSINRAIQNPLFALIFIGAPLFLMISTVMQYGHPLSMRFCLLLAATLIYLSGSLSVTIFGNLPLNAELESCNLASASIEEMYRLRTRFQNPWNFLHTIRTVSSIISLILLIIACLSPHKYHPAD